MKKTSKLVILALLVVGAVMTLCACGLVAGAQAIEIVNPPKQDYVTTDTDFDWTGFQIKVIYSENDSKTFTYEDLKKEAETNNQILTISAFDNTEGKHTAIITYMGVSVAFEYTVNAGLFAGGDGTEANPYQIATAEQFYRLAGDQKGNHFVLINDIDFNNKVETIEWAANFTLNGNGYALEGVNTGLFDVLGGEDWRCYKYDLATVIDDVNIHIVEAGTLVDSYIVGAEVVVSNINIYGVYENNSVGGNQGIVTGHISAKEATLSNINIYADFITYSQYASPFVGGYIVGGTDYNYVANITMNGCNFYGKAQAQRIGLFFGNAGNSYVGQSDINVSIANSRNYGELVAITATYFGTGANTEGKFDTTVDKNADISEAFGSDVPGLGKTNTIPVVETKTTDGLFKFDSMSGAEKYDVVVSVWGNYSNTESVVTADNRDGTLTTNVFKYTTTFADWSGIKFGKLTARPDATDSIEDLTFNTERAGYWVEAKAYTTTYTVWALDDSGNIIGFGVAVA